METTRLLDRRYTLNLANRPTLHKSDFQCITTTLSEPVLHGSPTAALQQQDYHDTSHQSKIDYVPEQVKSKVYPKKRRLRLEAHPFKTPKLPERSGLILVGGSIVERPQRQPPEL